MITLDQVKLLETKVVRAVEYVERVSRENSQLQGKLDSYQNRIGELEVLIQKFKEDQGRIEEGILSALDRLNRFEDIVEKSISPLVSDAESKPAGRLAGGSGGQKKESPGPVPPPNPGPAVTAKPAAVSKPGPAETAAEPEAEFPDTETIEKLEPDTGEDTEEIPFEDESSPDSPASGELDIF
jgi:hypothetical protein